MKATRSSPADGGAARSRRSRRRSGCRRRASIVPFGARTTTRRRWRSSVTMRYSTSHHVRLGFVNALPRPRRLVPRELGLRVLEGRRRRRFALPRSRRARAAGGRGPRRRRALHPRARRAISHSARASSRTPPGRTVPRRRARAPLLPPPPPPPRPPPPRPTPPPPSADGATALAAPCMFASRARPRPSSVAPRGDGRCPSGDHTQDDPHACTTRAGLADHLVRAHADFLYDDVDAWSARRCRSEKSKKAGGASPLCNARQRLRAALLGRG